MSINDETETFREFSSGIYRDVTFLDFTIFDEITRQKKQVGEKKSTKICLNRNVKILAHTGSGQKLKFISPKNQYSFKASLSVE